MSISLSNHNDNETSNLEYNESVLRIENIEQSIIQHIRTSGIRKPRETALIDELLDLRKERRIFSSSIHNQLKSLESQNKLLFDELNELKKNTSNELKTAQDNEKLLQIQLQTEKLHFEERLKKELHDQEEKLKFLESMNMNKLKKKYEERVKMMDDKVSEVFKEKAKSDMKEARSLATDLAEKAKVQIERRYNEKLAE